MSRSGLYERWLGIWIGGFSSYVYTLQSTKMTRWASERGRQELEIIKLGGGVYVLHGWEPPPKNDTLDAALDNLARAIALDGNRSKENKQETVTPITIRISGSGFRLETTVSMETARKVVHCINQIS